MPFKDKISSAFTGVKQFLASLSFKTGAVVAGACVVFYAVSFAQMLLPLSAVAKGVLWVIFFGLAKTAQYTAIFILGKEGIRRLRALWRL